MKTILIYLFLITAPHSFVLSQSEKLDCNELRASIVLAKKSINDFNANRLKEQYPSYRLDAVDVVETRGGLEKYEEFRAIQKHINIHKEKCLSCFGGTVQDPVDMALFFKAAEVLSREEYIKFVTAAADLVESGAISKQQYNWALRPFSKHLRDMWAEDPISKPLQQLALRARAVMADDASFCAFVDKVLSRKLAPAGAPRRTIPPLDDGSAPLDLMKSRLPSSQDAKTAPFFPDQSSALWPWSIVLILIVSTLVGMWWKIIRK
jgi:hypothetical protein